VGPTIEYAPLKELKPSRIRFMFTYSAPWWQFISQKLLSRVPLSDVLERVAGSSIQEIRDVIIRVINEGVRSLL
jgi:hypothetical protein